ncbi:unnamed protein product [Rhizoctonia solani]|uniref:Endonuclease 3 n=1 Tax=Rhizoctonia solani TaxID=456999 RepID=A0A8H3B897_9AGAM|nr:unnamed protein product [Rhizoctonia solani]
MRASLTFALASLASPAFGWGMFGHQITATIAQVYLLPSAREAICNILPATYKCNLVGVASWPDEIKQDDSYKTYSNLHYVNAKGDDPPKKCVFGELGWEKESNILKGIVDEARKVINAENPDINRDHALRFLVHFLGDIHQPFHLTGQYVGANQDLHAVWDDSFIDHQVLFVNSSEYTSVLPISPSAHISPSELARNQRIEAALKGLNYDPYIRFILLEGVYRLWAADAKEWIACPRASTTKFGGHQAVFDKNSGIFSDPSDLPTVCPLHWATQIHPLLCTPIWPEGLTNQTERRELSEDYATSIRDALIIEKQLAMGGIRLASVLNGLFGSDEDKAAYGIVPLFE